MKKEDSKCKALKDLMLGKGGVKSKKPEGEGIEVEIISIIPMKKKKEG